MKSCKIWDIPVFWLVEVADHVSFWWNFERFGLMTWLMTWWCHFCIRDTTICAIVMTFRCNLWFFKMPEAWKKVDMRFQISEVDINVKFDEFQKYQNVHKIWFWPILMTFIFDLKFDLIDLKPHVKFFFLQTSCIVQLFDFFDISHIASGEYITAATALHKEIWLYWFLACCFERWQDSTHLHELAYQN